MERRRNDHRLNYHYAELLRNYMPFDREQLMYYYRRGFTPGDSNYQAQFWFARYGYNSTENKKHQEAVNIFEYLRNARLSYTNKIKIRDYDIGKDSLITFEGVIRSKKGSFGFIRVDGSGYDVYFPISSVEDDMWEAFREGDRVIFNLGYSYSGVVACHISC